MTLPEKLVCFAHGKESGPWGTKITQLASIARRRGFEVLSPDYSQTPDPRARVAQLLALRPQASESLVLVGSSMGGYVSAMACEALKPTALFLMAPAFYFPGFDEEPPPPPPVATVVHGWNDDIVPVERAIRYAQQHRVRLTLIDSGHTLNDRLPAVTQLFDELLQHSVLDTAYRRTNYVVGNAGNDLALRIGHLDATADQRLAEQFGIRQHWALVTACNPRSQILSNAENTARIAQLRQELDDAAIGHFSTTAVCENPEWPSEIGELLCDPPVGFAEGLAGRHDQNAIVRGELGRAPELVWLA